MNWFKIKAYFIIVIMVFASTTITFPVCAQDAGQNPYKDFPAEAMAADLLVIRPLGIVSTTLGCVLFVAALPFTAWNAEYIKKAGRNFVVEPAIYTFIRPLGEFE